MGIFDWFYEDPSKKALPYLEKIPGSVSPYLNPYIGRGERSGGILEGEYGNLIHDPNEILNRFGAGYQKSPGLDFAIKRALEGSNRAAAAGGMAGSPAHQEQNMQLAGDLASKDYYDYLDRVLGLYGQGLSGEEGLYGKGFNASQDMASYLANMLGSEAGLQYGGTQSRNRFIGDILNNIFTGGGAALGKYFERRK